MPVEMKLWKFGEEFTEIYPDKLSREERIHSCLFENPDMLGLSFLPIGREVRTAYDKKIDILGLDQDGNTVIIELKKDRTPRDIVAQCLDYASWVKDLDYETIESIFKKSYINQDLESAFSSKFGIALPDTLNSSHQMVIVAAELDPQTERIVKYLSDEYKIPINAVFFRYFKLKNDEILARAWLLDPQLVEKNAAKLSKKSRKNEAWNGQDYYVSLGEGDPRTWDDCRDLGFISGGGGLWYSQTLKNLEIGNRVFVNIPGKGFVGIGIVQSTSKPMKDAVIVINGIEKKLSEMQIRASNHTHDLDNPDLCEYVVGVKWLKTVNREQAYWEKGLFAIQHTTCRLKSQSTIDKLTVFFGIEEI